MHMNREILMAALEGCNHSLICCKTKWNRSHAVQIPT